MTPERRATLIYRAALAAGAVIFVATLYYIDFSLIRASGPRLGLAFVLAVAASGAWHLVRTCAWSWCFRRPIPVPFRRLARVRLAAEAFSYLTLRGIAGEPLKVVLLRDRVDARDATAAVALERLAYIVGTTLIVGIGSVVAIAALPLSPVWFRVFRAFAIAAGVVAVLTAFVVGGRGTYVGTGLRRLDRLLRTRMSEGRVGRFAADVERLLLELVRGNTSRLMVLLATAVAAYVFMCLEVWLILRAMGIPISIAGAVTIETFSRVASFASAFIPANLGALEAASLAAVTAVGASPAGAPLALARRLRGVFWAGVGLALYPPRRRPSSASSAVAAKAEERRRPTLLYVPTDESVRVSPFARLAGMAIAERVLRAAFRAGYGQVIAVADRTIAQPMRRVAGTVRGDVRIVTAVEWRDRVRLLPGNEYVTVIGAGTVVSPSLLAEAAAQSPHPDRPDVAAGAGSPISGVLRLAAARAQDLAHVSAALHDRLRADTPMPSGEDVSEGRARLALRVRNEGELAVAEHTIRRATYKTTDNKLARFNRRLSLPISIALIRTPLTANQLSLVLVALGFYSAWLFSLGRYGTSVLAAFVSLAASVLDGCDGEIARLKYQETALGCWIETFGDYSYYLAIFLGMTVGAVRSTGMPIFYWIGSVALAATLIAFALLIFLRSRITAGQPENLHAIARARLQAEGTRWSALIWRISFVATRSAMPYGIFALSLLGLTPLVVILAAIGANTYWISLVVKLKQLMGGEPEPASA